MNSKVSKFFSAALITASLMTATIPAFAAAPDGLGPWADKVKKFDQGEQNNGDPVLPIRSDPKAALGVAEGDTVEGHFVSLGFGGKLVLKFKNGIKDGVFVVESTNLPYGTETANVEISANGKNWKTAGTVSRSGSVKQPKDIKCAHFVRITDTSDKTQFEPTADGFDVDGIKAEGSICKKEDDEDHEEDEDHDCKENHKSEDRYDHQNNCKKD